MKKIVMLFIISVLVLSLTSCSLVFTSKPNEPVTDKQGESTDNSATSQKNDEYVSVPPSNQAEAVLTEQGFEKVERKKTEERTIDELLQALRDGETMTDSSGAEYSKMPQTFSTDLTEAAQFQGTTVEYSEEPWETEKTVEEFNMDDLVAQMPPEERAEFEEMMSMTEEEWEAMISEMEAEIEEMANSFGDDGSSNYEGDYTYPDTDGIEMPDMADIQKQIQDAMNNLPEGYEELIPDGINIASILGGY